MDIGGTTFSSTLFDAEINVLKRSDKRLISGIDSSADLSPTAAQMPRLLGLALASKYYRDNNSLSSFKEFTNNGNEVAFGTIGDASTSEGIFWETINAAGVLQVPLAISVWDDGYGISVPKKYQTTKASISEALAGMQMNEGTNGIQIYRVNGWDYPALITTYEKAIDLSRTKHIPVLIHVEEVTQPQGHSTSGSHERYKSKERLEWAKEYDCINQFKKWILSKDNAMEEPLTSIEELDTIQKEAKEYVKVEAKKAWKAYIEDIKDEKEAVSTLIVNIAELDTL